MRISDWSSDVCSSDLLPRLLGDRRGAGVAAADDVVAIVGLAFGALAAAGDHEGRPVIVTLDGVGEGVERRLGRTADLRADVAASHRVRRSVVDTPACQRLDIALVEATETVLGTIPAPAQPHSTQDRRGTAS